MTHAQRRAYQDAYSKAYRAYKRAGWSVYSCRVFARVAGNNAADLVPMTERELEQLRAAVNNSRRLMAANIEKVSDSL